MRLRDSFFTIVGSPVLDTAGADFRVRFNPEHVIYKAHFPGKPVTPGVCLVRMAVELLEELTTRRLRLVEVKNVKFVTVLSPKDALEVNFCVSRLSQDGELLQAMVMVKEGDVVFSKMSLVCQVVEETT